MTYTIQARSSASRPTARLLVEDGQRGDQAGTALSAGFALGGGQHRAEQAREARVDVLAAQRHVAVRALGARVRQPGLAQHLEVMRAGGLGDAEVERPARALALARASWRTIATRTDRSARPSRPRASALRYGVRRSACSMIIVLRATSTCNVRRSSNHSLDLLPSLTAALAWGAMFPIAASAITTSTRSP